MAEPEFQYPPNEPPPVAPRGRRNVRMVVERARYGADIAVYVRGLAPEGETDDQRDFEELKAVVMIALRTLERRHGVSPEEIVRMAQTYWGGDNHV